MAKYTNYFLLCVIFFLGSCQSVEQLSIDYMLPADVSFPTALKRVAVINNTPTAPDNKLIVSEGGERKGPNEIARLTNYYNGHAASTTEALAQALAKENYFDEVVICDSALRSKDITPRETTLGRDEVIELTQALGVDFLIALENIQLSSLRKINYVRDWDAYQGTVDVKVFPCVKVYLPNRNAPMVTVNSTDSIFWEEFGSSEAYIRTRLIGEEDLIQQASEFAGAAPIKHLLPYWKTSNRFLVTGGSVEMRDAAIYAKKEDWAKATKLWEQVYNTKQGKKKMYAAHNMALGYEMQDNIKEAVEWAQKAQTLAKQVDKVEDKLIDEVTAQDIPNYYFTTLYLVELKEREEGITRLNIQMSRFKDDF